MTSLNRFAFKFGQYLPWSVRYAITRQIFREAAADPTKAIDRDKETRPLVDNAIFDIPEIRELCIQSDVEAYRHGLLAFGWDIRLITRPWGFPLEEIKVPVHLWHGTADNSTTVAMARHMTNKIPNCKFTLCEGEGHMLLIPRWEEILSTALGGRSAGSGRGDRANMPGIRSFQVDRMRLLPPLLLAFFAGCATIVSTLKLDDRFGPPDPARFDRPTAAVSGAPDYWTEVRPLLDRRCVSCHACYDSPCQLNLTSHAGLTRGANPKIVYSSVRLVAATRPGSTSMRGPTPTGGKEASTRSSTSVSKRRKPTAKAASCTACSPSSRRIRDPSAIVA